MFAVIEDLKRGFFTSNIYGKNSYLMQHPLL
jgi:hypothetical protein